MPAFLGDVFHWIWQEKAKIIALLLVLVLLTPQPAKGQFIDWAAVVAAINAIGTAISRPRIDVTIVPKMNGKAPKSSVTGFHWEEVKNPHPNLWRDAAELTQSWCTSSTATTRMLAAKAKATQRAITSPV